MVGMLASLMIFRLTAIMTFRTNVMNFVGCCSSSSILKGMGLMSQERYDLNSTHFTHTSKPSSFTIALEKTSIATSGHKLSRRKRWKMVVAVQASPLTQRALLSLTSLSTRKNTFQRMSLFTTSLVVLQ